MSDTEETTTPQVPEIGQRLDGRCKWFNNKAGYGFITASSGSQEGQDVFVHHSALKVSAEQYKYLVQGEYVEFEVSETDGEGDHKWQAADVQGVKGGKLMCETRNETREARAKTGDGERRPARRPRQWQAADEGDSREWNTRGPPRRGGRGPRSIQDENGVEWLLVRKRGDSGGNGGGNGGGNSGRRRREYEGEE